MLGSEDNHLGIRCWCNKESGTNILIRFSSGGLLMNIGSSSDFFHVNSSGFEFCTLRPQLTLTSNYTRSSITTYLHYNNDACL
jgi:hypothetical protein